MAVKINLFSSLTEFDIGGKIFKADLSDEKATAFKDKIKSFDVDSQLSDTEIVDFFRNSFEILFGEENPFDFIVEKTGRQAAAIEVATSIMMEIESMALNNVKSISAKYNKYTDGKRSK